LAALAPDVILASGGPSLAALQHVNRALPIVFVATVDPVGAGFVDSLARPGQFEREMAGASQADRAGHDASRCPSRSRRSFRDRSVRRHPECSAITPGGGEPVNLRNTDEIERAVAAFARSGNGGLIVTPSASASLHRDLIIMLAARHKLPAVCPYRYMVAGGGLMSLRA
jgi:putative ABC transport system substrate-binding protein